MFKAQSALELGHTNFVSSYPIDFPLPIFWSPLEICHETLNFFAQSDKEFEATLIANIGMAKAILLIRHICYLGIRVYLSKFVNVITTWSLRRKKLFFLDLPTIEGRPKYFLYCVTPQQLQIAIISFLTFFCTFLLKTIVVFSVFMY